MSLGQGCARGGHLKIQEGDMVGKTTTVINIAAQLALRGFRVLVIDSDSQGNCATGLGVDKSRVRTTTRDLILNPETAVDSRHATAVDNLHIIVGDKSLIGLEQEMMRQLGREKRMKEALEPLLAHYDLVLIDTPPSLGLVTINALVASDGILVPVQTEYFALEGLALLAGTIREVRSLLNDRLGVYSCAALSILYQPRLERSGLVLIWMAK